MEGFSIATAEGGSQHATPHPTIRNAAFVEQGIDRTAIRFLVTTPGNSGFPVAIRVPEGKTLFRHDVTIIPEGRISGEEEGRRLFRRPGS